MAGAGIVSLGAAVATDLRKRKSSTMIGPAHRTRPVTVGIGGTSSAWNFTPAIGATPTPSNRLRKSRCQKSRRYSPSVTTCSPIASCFATALAISRSSTARRSAGDRAPARAWARARCSSAGRRRLPMCSARNGGPAVIRVPPCAPASCGLERVERPAAVLVSEEAQVGAGDAVAVAEHDVSRNGLEARAEVLTGLDQHVALAARIDAAVGEPAGVEGLAAALGDDDLHGAGVEHRSEER